VVNTTDGIFEAMLELGHMGDIMDLGKVEGSSN
jgi:hypothetical protein